MTTATTTFSTVSWGELTEREKTDFNEYIDLENT
jgi:hypothetical protein